MDDSGDAQTADDEERDNWNKEKLKASSAGCQESMARLHCILKASGILLKQERSDPASAKYTADENNTTPVTHNTSRAFTLSPAWLQTTHSLALEPSQPGPSPLTAWS
ncbi:hypothetical protein Pcinc_021106 [Petrolisthes cinctipes]|uniref:Uncharacterized protein n=1 Tax=Petrolisthes cinctipes TaxID=88211 RepID=A0AAE1KI26_PETCI|nr:hypothetical protein Pcinc_021106 [Petrolisthes cinctipes]